MKPENKAEFFIEISKDNMISSHIEGNGIDITNMIMTSMNNEQKVYILLTECLKLFNKFKLKEIKDAKKSKVKKLPKS